jgi:hypothetical protein
MINQNSYRIWLKLVITHEYFDVQQCGLTLEPNSITQGIFQKAGVIFKQQNACTWVLIAEDQPNLEYEINLCFQLKIHQSDFYYYTNQASSTTSDCEIKDYNKDGIWKLVNIPVTEERLKATDSQSIELQFSNEAKHIEFLVFPSKSYPMDPLEVREQRGKVLFNAIEKLTLPGTEKALYRFVSSKTVPLKQKSPYQFHLWELRKSGENLLSRLPDFPLVQSLSPFSPKDTITSYIYL